MTPARPPSVTQGKQKSMAATSTFANDSFFDFTQEVYKADTPDLVPTSFTNPSTESGFGSEVDYPPVPTSVGTTVGDKAQIVDTSESELKSDFFDSGAFVHEGKERDETENREE